MLRDEAKRSEMPAGLARSEPGRWAPDKGSASRWASVGVIGLSLLLTPAWGVFLAWLAYRLVMLATG